MVSVCRMSVYLCYLARSHAIASLIEFLWFSFINFGAVARDNGVKFGTVPAIFGMVGNYARIPDSLAVRRELGESRFIYSSNIL